MPSNDREVFAHVQNDPETDLASDFLTYAVFAGEKQQWIELWESKHGTSPTQADIDNWISNLTDSQFLLMRSSAETFLGTVIDDYTKERIEAEKADALRNAIVREVRAAGAFWKQLALALICAILAPVILGVIIGGTILYEKGMRTATGLSHMITGDAQPQGAKPDLQPSKP